jgi:HIRAN domain
MIFRLVGISHLPPAVQTVAKALKPGTLVHIWREPQNKFDRLACRVECQRIKVGYIPADDNRTLARIMDHHGKESVAALIVARNVPGIYLEVEVNRLAETWRREKV